MKLTQEQELEYEMNRLTKNRIDRGVRIMGLAFVLIAAFFFVFAMFATAEKSGDPTIRGAWKWYYGMNAGAWNVIFAIGTLVLGIIASAGSRISNILVMLLHLGIIIWVIAGRQIALGTGNLLLAGFGLACSVNLFRLRAADGALSELPGYPLFLPRAEQGAEYEPSPLIMRHPQSEDMDSIGGESAAPTPKSKRGASVPEMPADVQIDAMGGVSHSHAPTESAMQTPEGIALDSLHGDGRSVPDAVLPPGQPSSDAVLSDMDTGMPHGAHGGDASALPDPDEVRARLARMRAEREAGVQPGSVQ